MSDSEPVHLLCHRCGCDLTPGEGNFYIVRIEAFADPTPPNIPEGLDAWSDQDFNAEFDKLIDQMETMTDRELMDGVYRRLSLHLCSRCYRQWIENPTG